MTCHFSQSVEKARSAGTNGENTMRIWGEGGGGVGRGSIRKSNLRESRTPMEVVVRSTVELASQK